MGTLLSLSGTKSKGRLIPLSSSANSGAATVPSATTPPPSATSTPTAVTPANSAASTSAVNLTTPSAVTSPSGGRLIPISSAPSDSTVFALTNSNKTPDISTQNISKKSRLNTTKNAPSPTLNAGYQITHGLPVTMEQAQVIRDIPQKITEQNLGANVGNALARQSGRNTSPVQPSALATQYASVMTPQERQLAQSLSVPELGAYINKNRSDFNQRVTNRYLESQSRIAATIERSADSASESESLLGRHAAASATGDKKYIGRPVAENLAPEAVYMSDAQKNTVRKLADAGDFKAVADYYNALKWTLEDIAAEQRQRTARESVQTNAGPASAVAKGTAATVGTGVINAFGGIPGYIYSGANILRDAVSDTYTPINPNASAFAPTQISTGLQQGVSDLIEQYIPEDASVFGFSGRRVANMMSSGMSSGISNLLQLYTGQALGLSGKSLAEFITTTMSLSAGGQAMYQNLSDPDYAQSNGTAFANATANAMIEYWTEHMTTSMWVESLAERQAGKFTKAAYLKSLGLRTGAEMWEEVVGNVADQSWDRVFNGPNSEFARLTESLMEQGMDRKAAEQQAFEQLYIDQSVDAALSVAFSMIFMDGVPAVQTRIAFANTGKNLRRYGGAEAVNNEIVKGELFDKESPAYQQAKKVGEAWNDGKGKISNRELGRLAFLNGQEISNLFTEIHDTGNTDLIQSAAQALALSQLNAMNKVPVDVVRLLQSILSEARDGTYQKYGIYSSDMREFQETLQRVDLDAQGKPLVSYADAVEEIKKRYPTLKDKQIQQIYQTYRDRTRTVLFGGYRLTREQFGHLMENVKNNGQNLTSEEIDGLFNRAILDTLVDKTDAYYRYMTPAQSAEQSAPENTKTQQTENKVNQNAQSLISIMRQAIPQMEQTPTIADVIGNEIPQGSRLVDRVMDFVNSIGNKVHRSGFGDVFFSKSRIKNSLLGHGIGQAKIDTFAAVPAVIRNGQQIDYQQNWKGRGYDTYTFAAPVSYKGDRTYLGVIVTKDRADGRYYVHEVIDSEGNLILGEKNTEVASDGRATQKGAFDTVATSTDIVSESAETVNTAADENADIEPDASPGLVMDDMVPEHLTQAERVRIDSVARQLGKRVEFVESVAGGIANAEISGDVIRIARDTDAPVLYVLGHEWTHGIQRDAPRAYQDFLKAVENDKFFADEVKKIQAAYTAKGLQITSAQARDEAAANYAGQMLQNGQVLDQFIERNWTKPTLLQRVRDALVNLWNKLTGREKRIANNALTRLNAALDEAAENVRNRDTTVEESTDSAAENVTEESSKQPNFNLKMSEEDFKNRESPVWNNVDYEDTETRSAITHRVHQEMVKAGQVVTVSQETQAHVAEFYPDLRSEKKSERVQKLRAKMNALKSDLRNYLNGLKGVHEFTVNGTILEAWLYEAGVAEVMTKITQEKAAILYHSADIFQNARYLYSTSPIHGNPNVHRWNYFYSPIRIGNRTIGVRIAIRDMVPTVSGNMDSQIYNWSIKNDVALDDGGPGQIPNTTGVSSATFKYNIPDSADKSKTQFSQNSENITDEPSGQTQYSLKGSETTLEMARMREVQGDVAAKINALADYQGWTQEPSGQYAVREDDAAKLARKLVKDFGAKLTAEQTRELGAMIKDASEKMLITLTGAEVQKRGLSEPLTTVEQFQDATRPIAKMLVENARQIANQEQLDDYANIKKRFRTTRLTISSSEAEDIEDWTEFRKRNSLRFRGISVDKGTVPGYTGVDVLYTEMSEQYPQYFPENITAPSDQLLQMVAVMDDMQPIYENPYGYDLQMATEATALEILERIADAAFEKKLREAPKGYVDRWADKIRTLQQEAAERQQRAVEKERTEAAGILERAVATERANREKQVAGIVEHYQQKEWNAKQRKQKSEAAQLVLKVLNRIQKLKKKSNRQTREQIDSELHGIAVDLEDGMVKMFPDIAMFTAADLDTQGVRLTEKKRMEIRRLRTIYMAQLDPESPMHNPDFIPDPGKLYWFERTGKLTASELTIEELEQLGKILLNLEHGIRTAKRLIGEEKARETHQLGQEVIRDIQNSPGSRATGPGGIVDTYVITETLSPIRAGKRMVDYVESDPLLQRLYDLDRGQRDAMDYRRRAESPFIDFEQEKSRRQFMRAFSGQDATEIQIEGEITENGKKVKKRVAITPAMRVSLYMHSQNFQNLRHIRDGGITIPDMTLYKKGRLMEAFDRGVTVKLTPSQVREITKSMSPDEIAYAQLLQQYFEQVSKPEINRVSEMLLGYPVAEVEHYYPIRTDSAFLATNFESIRFDGTVEGFAFLKERMEKAKTPIFLLDADFEIKRSINDHSLYVGMAVPIRNFNKVYGVTTASYVLDKDGQPIRDENGQYVRSNYESSVQKAIGQKWGENGKKYFEQMMHDLQRPTTDTDVISKLIAKGRSNYAQAVLTLNRYVALKQAASYPTAAAVLGGKALIKGLRYLPEVITGKFNAAEVAEYTPLLWHRSQGYSSPEMGEITNRKDRVSRIMREHPNLNWIQKLDVMTTQLLWRAAEEYVADHQKSLKRDSVEFKKAVAEIYNRTIEETQPNYTVMQRPQILRHHGIAGAYFMFKTQIFQNFNILYDAWGNLQAKKRAVNAADNAQTRAALKDAWKNLGRAAISQIIAQAMITAIDLFRNLRRDKFQDEEGNFDWDAMWKSIALDMISAPLAMVPVLKELWDVFRYVIYKEPYYGTSDPGLESVSALTSRLYSSVRMLEKMKDEEGKFVFAFDKDFNSTRLSVTRLSSAVASLLGIPAGNVLGLFGDTVQTITRLVKSGPVGDYYALALTKNPVTSGGYNILYQALRDEDFDAFETISADMQKHYRTSSGTVVTGKTIRTRMQSIYKDEIRKHGSSTLSRKALDYIGQVTDWSPETKESAFSESSLSAAQYNKYNTERVQLYNRIMDEIDGYGIPDSPEMEELDVFSKIRTTANNLSKEISLVSNSGGQYQFKDNEKWMYWATAGADFEVTEAQAVLFKIACDISESDKDKNGKAVSGSHEKNALRLVRNWMPDLSARQLDYLRSYNWTPTRSAIKRLKDAGYR